MDLIRRIKNKTARVGVIRMGYVGLPLVREFCRAGFNVTGFDIDNEKIRKPTQRHSQRQTEPRQVFAQGLRPCPQDRESIASRKNCPVVLSSS